MNSSLNDREIKIIALDLDGTLLNSRKELSERNKNALKAAAEKGVYIVPTTGRLACALTSSVSSLPFLKYVIAVNGAVISDIENGLTLKKEEISNSDVLRIIDVLKDYPGIFDCYINGKGYMSESMYRNVKDYTYDDNQYRLVKETRTPVKDLRSFVLETGCNAEKSQIMFRTREDKERYAPEIERRLPDFVHSCTYFTNIEINQKNATKGKGLLYLCEYLGIDPACSMSFGDSTNDISMLQDAGIGVVMGNAEEFMYKYGNVIAPSNDEDGVAQIIERYVLKQRL